MDFSTLFCISFLHPTISEDEVIPDYLHFWILVICVPCIVLLKFHFILFCLWVLHCNYQYTVNTWQELSYLEQHFALSEQKSAELKRLYRYVEIKNSAAKAGDKGF